MVSRSDLDHYRRCNCGDGWIGRRLDRSLAYRKRVDQIFGGQVVRRCARRCSDPDTARSAGRALVNGFGSPYRAGRSTHWLKVKNPAAPAVRKLKVVAEWSNEETDNPLSRTNATSTRLKKVDQGCRVNRSSTCSLNGICHMADCCSRTVRAVVCFCAKSRHWMRRKP